MELLKKIIFKTAIVVTISLPTALMSGLPAKALKQIRPHLLAEDHPVTLHLNQLFEKSRFIRDVSRLKKAGFQVWGPRKFTGLVVAKHPDTPGYIYKIYTDVQEFYKSLTEYEVWLKRIEGAGKIRDYIEQHQWGDQFKVPQKWIYLIPESSIPSKNYYPKYTILVEEDMDILSNKENLAIWGGDSITPAFLDQIYQMITELGLTDCAKPDNIPFSVDSRVAFIDTQSHGNSYIAYDSLTRHLNKANKKYWKKLTNE